MLVHGADDPLGCALLLIDIDEPRPRSRALRGPGARQLGMRTVAEQIDRPVLVERLRDLGVDDGQDHHLGRPRPLEDLLGQR